MKPKPKVYIAAFVGRNVKTSTCRATIPLADFNQNFRDYWNAFSKDIYRIKARFLRCHKNQRLDVPELMQP